MAVYDQDRHLFINWLDRLLERFVWPDAHADDVDTRTLGYYLSSVCGDGSERNPRRPCLADIAGFKDMVVLWDGGATMVFKALGSNAQHDATSIADRVGRGAVDRTRLSTEAKRYLDERGEGRINRR